MNFSAVPDIDSYTDDARATCSSYMDLSVVDNIVSHPKPRSTLERLTVQEKKRSYVLT